MKLETDELSFFRNYSDTFPTAFEREEINEIEDEFNEKQYNQLIYYPNTANRAVKSFATEEVH